jgi:hypothetical protein
MTDPEPGLNLRSRQNPARPICTFRLVTGSTVKARWASDNLQFPGVARRPLSLSTMRAMSKKTTPNPEQTVPVPALETTPDEQHHSHLRVVPGALQTAALDRGAPDRTGITPEVFVAVALDEQSDLSQRRDLGFDIVAFYAEDATGTVPTAPFPGSRHCIVRSMVLAVLPHST